MADFGLDFSAKTPGEQQQTVLATERAVYKAIDQAGQCLQRMQREQWYRVRGYAAGEWAQYLDEHLDLTEAEAQWLIDHII